MHTCGPFTFHIDTNLGLVTIVPSGVPTPAEYEAVMDAITNHADFRPDFNILSDRRGQPGSAPTVKALHGIVSLVASKITTASPGSRVAVLVDDDATFGMFRIAEVRFEERGVELRVFRQEEAALRWLKAGQASEDVV